MIYAFASQKTLPISPLDANERIFAYDYEKSN